MTPDVIRWLVLICLALAGLFMLYAARLWRVAATAQTGAPQADEAPSLTRPEERSEIERQLEQAGFHGRNAHANLLRAKLLLGLLGLALGGYIGASTGLEGQMRLILMMVFGVGLGLMGVFAPTFYIDRRRAAHRARIAKAVPDALDFMQICMEAGQSVDAALMRVTAELDVMHPDLAVKFRRLTESLAAGATRSAAFEQLSLDADNDDLRQFANMLDQATSLGASVSQTLRNFTVDLRDQRLRRTEAKANLIPTKMTLGSMLFTVPPLLIVLLAPSLMRLSGAF